MIEREPNSSPYFSVRMVNGKAETEGEPHCTLGHKLEPSKAGILDGIFTEWHWDGTALTVTNDRYGFFPVYVYKDEDSFVISPSIIRMLPFCRNRGLDGPALGVYYRTGSFIGNDTHFEHIKALGPNSKIKWSDGTLTQTGGEMWTQKPVSVTKEEVIEKYGRLFTRAIERRRPGPDGFIHPLSGGRDSRHILLELLGQGIKPGACVTFKDYPDWRGQDEPVAEALTKEAGLMHIILDQKKNRFETELKKNLITDLCSSRSVKMITLTDYLNENAETVYDGLGGMLVQSFFMNRAQMKLYKDGNFDPLTKAFLKQWSTGEDIFDLVLSEEMRELLSYKKAFAHLKEEVARHQPAANPIGSYFFWNRTRRDIALTPYAMMRQVKNVYSPFVDHDLCDFLFSIPADVIEPGTLHDEIIRKGYPQYAHVPFEDKSIVNPQADAHWAGFIRNFSIYYFKNKGYSSRFLNNGYLNPRLLRCVFDNSYRVKARWIPFVRLLNMMQLEQLTQQFK